jgi:hypothetical protein
MGSVRAAGPNLGSSHYHRLHGEIGRLTPGRALRRYALHRTRLRGRSARAPKRSMGSR